MAVTSIGLALGFAVAPANAEPTQAALVRFATPMVERTIDPTTHEVQFLAGEFIQISTYASFQGSALASHISSGNKLVVNAGFEIKSGSPLQSVSKYASINGGTGNTYINQSVSGDNPEFTLSAVPTYLSVNVSYAGTATTNVTIKFDPTYTVNGYTFVSGDFTTTNTNASTGLFMPGSAQNAPVLGHSFDSSISFNPESACVDTSSLAQGDVVVASYNVSDGSTSVGSPFYNWNVKDASGMMSGAPGMSSTYTLPAIPSGSKLVFSGDVTISPVTAGKTYTFTDYKVVKQGTTTNLLTHCKETLATGVLSVSGTTVTGTLTTTADSSSSGGGMPAMPNFYSYGCTLYTTADTNFATPVKSAGASTLGQGGGMSNPTCNVRNVPSGTYKMGIRGFSFNGVGSEKILAGTITVAGGVVTPALKTPKAPTVATKVKVGKTFTIALHATKGTAAKGANSDGLATTVKVAPSSHGYCSATAVKKSGKITGYTVRGLHAGKCTVLVTITGSSKFKSRNLTTKVTVSK
jgi:hypothetical protein